MRVWTSGVEAVMSCKMIGESAGLGFHPNVLVWPHRELYA